MKIGAEDRRKVVVACGLTVLAVLLIGHWIFGSQWSAFAHEAGSVMSPIAPTHPVAKTKARRSDSLDPTLRLAQLELTEHEMYEGTGRNIFQSLGKEPEEQTKKTRPASKSSKPPDTILVTAARPPIGLRFFGVATEAGSPRKVCLTQDGDVFIGTEGSIIDRRYKIVHIGSNSVDLEDLLENTQYTLPLQQ